MSSLLDSLPIAAQTTSYEEPSGLASLMGTVEGATTIWDLLGLGGGGGDSASASDEGNFFQNLLDKGYFGSLG